MKTDRIFYYEIVSTAFGPMGVVWREGVAGPRVQKTLLSRGVKPVEEVIRQDYPAAVRFSSPPIVGICNQIRLFLEGRAVVFNLEMVALEQCGEFQRRVLLAEYGIPRGWVSTYGRIARHIGSPGAGRAVGTALAENPFPIIIPCHRAVRADGAIGGYQGGKGMKRALLEMEGVEFKGARVSMERVCY
jgi:methylated-DNA-[protein]-cysteine S-methyltransferase